MAEVINADVVDHGDLEQIIENDFAALIDNSIPNWKEGDLVTGIVKKIEPTAVVIDVGLKSEGRVPKSEFMIGGRDFNVEVGDQVEVVIESFENRWINRGAIVTLSRERALRYYAWKRIEKKHLDGEYIDGAILGKVRGGFAVDVGGGLVAFLPGSQVDVKPVKNVHTLLSIIQKFKILKMDPMHGNMVISRREVVEEHRKEIRDELLSTITEGSVLDGVVKNITGYGAFVDLGPTDGLLHITDISWRKITHPSDVLSIGQKVKVVVIKYNKETQRISLGLKQFEKNPWEKLREKYYPGSRHHGVVNALTDYGAFVSVEPEIDGLVYYTEIDWKAHNVHPSKMLKIGDKVDVIVLELDIPRHRMSLSIKKCTKNPWITFDEEYPVGTHVDTVVKNVTDFGIFVVLDAHKDEAFPINILISAAEIQGKNGDADLRNYSKGDKIRCVITVVDKDRERVAASIKKLESSTDSSVVKKWIGAITDATVTAIKKDGFTVELPDGTITFMDKRHADNVDDEKNTTNLSVGDKIEVKVLSYDERIMGLKVSVKDASIAKNTQIMAEFSSKDGKNSDNKGGSFGKLGTILTENDENINKSK